MATHNRSCASLWRGRAAAELVALTNRTSAEEDAIIGSTAVLQVMRLGWWRAQGRKERDEEWERK